MKQYKKYKHKSFVYLFTFAVFSCAQTAFGANAFILIDSVQSLLLNLANYLIKITQNSINNLIDLERYKSLQKQTIYKLIFNQSQFNFYYNKTAFLYHEKLADIYFKGPNIKCIYNISKYLYSFI